MTLTIHSGNLFNYINLSRADSSGMLRFLTDELQDAEDNGERGVFLRIFLAVRLLTSAISLDSRSRAHRLGWKRWAGSTDRPL
jgi:hypothetical protein